MTTEKTELKREILAAGIKKHMTVIQDFNVRIKQLMATDGTVNEDEYDSHLQSQKLELTTEASLLSDQLRFAARELDELQRLEWDLEENHTEVAFGTVVVTDNGTFFVSASIEHFSVKGQTIFGLSVHSPLYQQMKGKKSGDTFKHGETLYVIKDIF